MNKPVLKKSAQFKKLLPVIENKLEEGYSYEGVIEILKDEYDLELTLGVFRNYLSNFRKKISSLTVQNSQKLTMQNIISSVENFDTNVDNKNQVLDTDINEEITEEMILKGRAMLEEQKRTMHLKPTLAEIANRKK